MTDPRQISQDCTHAHHKLDRAEQLVEELSNNTLTIAERHMEPIIKQDAPPHMNQVVNIARSVDLKLNELYETIKAAKMIIAKASKDAHILSTGAGGDDGQERTPKRFVEQDKSKWTHNKGILGARSICKSCAGEIYFNGDYWRRVDGRRYRHPCKPDPDKDPNPTVVTGSPPKSRPLCEHKFYAITGTTADGYMNKCNDCGAVFNKKQN